MELFSRIRPTASLLALLVAALLLLQAPLFGQVTTGTVTGTAADLTGAVIPHAKVELTDQQTGTVRTTTSNGVGYFAFASVIPSNYTVTVSAPKFQTWQSQPFTLRPGDQIGFTDIKMAVGEATEQVTVEASSSGMKALDTGEQSDVITDKELQTLSLVGRDATELVRMLPGFDMSSGGNGVGNKPGYNAAVVGLSGPTGSFSANGSGTNGIAVTQDGVSLTDIASNSGSVQNVNSDMIQEIKVQSSSFSAENNAGSPTVINVVGKSGSSKFHGEGYFYGRDTVLNANDWYYNSLKENRPAGRFLYPGGNVGGPVLLPHFLGDFNRNRDKMFFWVGYEYSNQLYSPETLGSWVPTLAERSGHFDQDSLNAQLCGARPDGAQNPNALLPMCQTENYLPNNYLTNGAGVPDGNVTSWANSSGVALINWLPLPNADPFTNASGFNYIKEVLQTQNGSQFHAKIDYQITGNQHLTLGYNRQSQIAEDPVDLNYVPNASILYPGNVTTGDISNALSANYIVTIGSSLTNELTAAMSYVTSPGNMSDPAAVDRFEMNTYNGGNGNYDYLGMYKNGGDYSVPALNAGNGGNGFPNMLMPGGFYNNEVRMKKVVPSVQDVLTLEKGTHLVKIGIYVEQGVLNGLADPNAYPQGEYTFNPGTDYFEYDYNPTLNNGPSIGQDSQFTSCESSDPAGSARLSGAAYLGDCMNPNALMYMGFADTFQQTNFSPTVDMQYTTVSGFINDSWKLHRFTVNLGIRLEDIGPWSDRHGNGLATFNSSLYDQQCTGRTCNSLNMPGLDWHSIDSSVSNSVNQPAKVAFSPRFGLSWDVFGKGNTIIRGGWGIYRTQEEFNPYALAAATAQGYKTSQLQGQLTFDSIDNQSPENPPDFSAYTISQSDHLRPLHYEYNLTFDQNLPWRSQLEIAFVSSNGDNLSSYNNGSYNSESNLNLIPFGTLFNVSLGSVPSTLGPAPESISDLNTPETDFFRPYPFYQNIYQLRHDNYSTYNSAQVSWNKSTGIVTFGANYTFQKNLATGASYNNNLADPFNLRNDYNPVPFDHTHVVNVHYLVDLGTHHHLGLSAVNEVINGWQISGISSWQTSPSLPSENGENFGFGYGLITPTQVPYANQTDLPNVASTCIQEYNIPADANGHHYCVTQLNPITWLGTPDIQLMPTITCNPKGGPAKNQYINGACFGIPLPGHNGQLRPPYLRGPAFMSNDISLLKNFSMGEKKNLQFRAAGFNFLNHPLVSFNNNATQTDLALTQQGGTPGQTLTQSDLTEQGFGIAGIKYGSRLVELSVKYEF